MIYDIRHRTTYGYEEPVSVSQHVLHLMPRDTPTQLRTAFELDIVPNPANVSISTDYFGNSVHHVSVQEPHRELIVESLSRIEVTAHAHANAATPAWEEIAAATVAIPAVDQITYDSPYALGTTDVLSYARASFPPGRPVLEGALDLTRRIYGEFKYEGGVSDVSTPVSQVLAMRKGVCQDFAHLELAALRSLGLPARYVSGYLLTRPPPGQPRLVGADASHAWVSVWCGSALSWIDLDPTNNVIPNIEHITVGWGRDYGDVSPINGFIIGGAGHHVAVGVDVKPISDAA